MYYCRHRNLLKILTMIKKLLGAALLLLSTAAAAYQAPPWAYPPHPAYARPAPAPHYVYARPRPAVIYRQPRYWRSPYQAARLPARPTTPALKKPAPAVAATIKQTPEKKPPAAKKKSTFKNSQQAFLRQLEPIIISENARLQTLREEAKGLIKKLQNDTLQPHDQTRLRSLARQYRVKNNLLDNPSAQADLLSRIDTIPTSLALAQAVNESAWGTSRFAREGNNLFGIWTYDESKGIIPKGRAPGQKHLVRKFDNLTDSVRYYLHTLNSHPAYQALRETRSALRQHGVNVDGMTLAGGLLKYSAKGEEYVRLIRQIIRRYDLVALDQNSRRSA